MTSFQTMACSCKIFLVLVLSLVDVAVTTVLFVHGDQFHKFAAEVYQFSIKDCFIDIWFLSTLRFSVIFGACIAVVCNPGNAIPRLRNSKGAILVVGGLVFLYLIVKLLIYSEFETDLRQPWFWGLFAWTTVAALLPYICWRILCHLTPQRQHLSINAEDGAPHENEKLLSNHVGDDADLKGYDSDESDGEPHRKKKSLQPGSLLRLLTYSSPDWFLLLIGNLALLATSIGEIFLPLFTGQVVDGIVVEKSYSKFTHAIVIMSLISVGTALTAGFRGTVMSIVIARLNIRIRNLLFTAITKQEIGFFDTTKTGDITSRLTSDITVMSDAIGLNFNVFLRNVVKIIGYLVLMFKLSWRLTVVTLISIPLIAVVSRFYGVYYKKLAKLVQETLALANNVAEETVSSMKTVRSFANEENENARYAAKLDDTYSVKLKQSFAYGGYVITNRILELALGVVVLYYGGHLVITGRMTPGNLISFVLYNLELSDALESIGQVYTGLMQAAGAAEKVFEMMDRVPEVSNNGSLLPGNIQGELEFRNVSFAYPTRPETEVLKNVSFKASPGEVIALVGPSGGGKSSCVNLIEHFYETTAGAVLIDNVPIQGYDHKYLHTKVALVGQEPVLYGRSIKENISYGLDELDMQQVQQAAQLANAHRFILELKDGYDTETGEKGTQLSGGQKQRVAIARALIRNPTVLLLDEATSALDSESEYCVQQAIYSNLQNRTVLIIAHRLSTIEKAHRIVVIDKGMVLEQGNHFELLAKNGLYAQLVQRQLLGTDDSTPSLVSNPQLNGPISSMPLNPLHSINIASTRHYDPLDDDSDISSSGGITFTVGSSL